MSLLSLSLSLSLSLVDHPRMLAWSRRPVTAPSVSSSTCPVDIWDIFINKLGERAPPVKSEKTKRPTTAKQHLSEYSRQGFAAESWVSAIGHMKIVEVQADGHFVRLRNCSQVEQDLGGYYLQQSVKGQPVSCFLFPPRTFVQSGVSITIWSEHCRSYARYFKDYVWTGLPNIGSTPEYTTILCMTNGQAVAWYTPAQRSMLRTRHAWEEPETGREARSSSAGWCLPRGDSKNVPPPDFTQQEPHPKHSASSPVIPHQRKSNVIRVSQSPWTQSPSSITHPDGFRGCPQAHATANTRTLTTKGASRLYRSFVPLYRKSQIYSCAVLYTFNLSLSRTPPISSVLPKHHAKVVLC
ncbi:hypothetical protein ACEWY4_002137 [Coilia grayii]|uniref:LTD domain-containing protein n=1 Tax=Coilia grayii TaxID=363190 RepID=A0ABD1KUY0_9TELE